MDSVLQAYPPADNHPVNPQGRWVSAHDARVMAEQQAKEKWVGPKNFNPTAASGSIIGKMNNVVGIGHRSTIHDLTPYVSPAGIQCVERRYDFSHPRHSVCRSVPTVRR